MGRVGSRGGGVKGRVQGWCKGLHGFILIYGSSLVSQLLASFSKNTIACLHESSSMYARKTAFHLSVNILCHTPQQGSLPAANNNCNCNFPLFLSASLLLLLLLLLCLPPVSPPTKDDFSSTVMHR